VQRYSHLQRLQKAWLAPVLLPDYHLHRYRCPGSGGGGSEGRLNSLTTRSVEGSAVIHDYIAK
jgi:hypothetical protein